MTNCIKESEEVLGYDCDGTEINEFRILRTPFSADIENWAEEPNIDPRFYCLVRSSTGEVHAISVYDDWTRDNIRRFERLEESEEVSTIVKPASEMSGYEVAFNGITGLEWFYDRDRAELRKQLNCMLKKQSSKIKTITINESKLSELDIDKFGNKARAVLVKSNKILISRYGGVILLPGGSIDTGETPEEAILRELREETGIHYNQEELRKFLTLKYFQPNYQERDSKTLNRLITTHYFLGDYKGIDLSSTARTEKEKKDNFHSELVTIEELIERLNEPSDNPRKEYFDRELKEVVKAIRQKRK